MHWVRWFFRQLLRSRFYRVVHSIAAKVGGKRRPQEQTWDRPEALLQAKKGANQAFQQHLTKGPAIPMQQLTTVADRAVRAAAVAQGPAAAVAPDRAVVPAAAARAGVAVSAAVVAAEAVAAEEAAIKFSLDCCAVSKRKSLVPYFFYFFVGSSKSVSVPAGRMFLAPCFLTNCRALSREQ